MKKNFSKTFYSFMIVFIPSVQENLTNEAFGTISRFLYVIFRRLTYIGVIDTDIPLTKSDVKILSYT